MFWSIRAPFTDGCNASFRCLARRLESTATPSVPTGGQPRRTPEPAGRWHYIYRAIDGQGQIVDPFVSPTRDMVAARKFYERAIASSGTTPRRVITDTASIYPAASAESVPGVLHRTGRYRTNGIE